MKRYIPLFEDFVVEKVEYPIPDYNAKQLKSTFELSSKESEDIFQFLKTDAYNILTQDKTGRNQWKIIANEIHQKIIKGKGKVDGIEGKLEFYTLGNGNRVVAIDDDGIVFIIPNWTLSLYEARGLSGLHAKGEKVFTVRGNLKDAIKKINFGKYVEILFRDGEKVRGKLVDTNLGLYSITIEDDKNTFEFNIDNIQDIRVIRGMNDYSSDFANESEEQIDEAKKEYWMLKGKHTSKRGYSETEYFVYLYPFDSKKAASWSRGPAERRTDLTQTFNTKQELEDEGKDLEKDGYIVNWITESEQINEGDDIVMKRYWLATEEDKEEFLKFLRKLKKAEKKPNFISFLFSDMGKAMYQVTKGKDGKEVSRYNQWEVDVTAFDPSVIQKVEKFGKLLESESEFESSELINEIQMSIIPFNKIRTGMTVYTDDGDVVGKIVDLGSGWKGLAHAIKVHNTFQDNVPDEMLNPSSANTFKWVIVDTGMDREAWLYDSKKYQSVQVFECEEITEQLNEAGEQCYYKILVNTVLKQKHTGNDWKELVRGTHQIMDICKKIGIITNVEVNGPNVKLVLIKSGKVNNTRLYDEISERFWKIWEDDNSLFQISQNYATIELKMKEIKSIDESRADTYEELIDKLDNEAHNLMGVVTGWTDDEKIYSAFNSEFDMKHAIKTLEKWGFKKGDIIIHKKEKNLSPSFDKTFPFVISLALYLDENLQLQEAIKTVPTQSTEVHKAYAGGQKIKVHEVVGLTAYGPDGKIGDIMQVGQGVKDLKKFRALPGIVDKTPEGFNEDTVIVQIKNHYTKDIELWIYYTPELDDTRNSVLVWESVQNSGEQLDEALNYKRKQPGYARFHPKNQGKIEAKITSIDQLNRKDVYMIALKRNDILEWTDDWKLQKEWDNGEGMYMYLFKTTNGYLFKDTLEIDLIGLELMVKDKEIAIQK